MARILITGGGGFIGSHTCLVLIEAGHDLIVLDSFINSSSVALQRVKEISGINQKNACQRLKIVRGDIRNIATLEKIFIDGAQENRPIEAVIHFAGLKSVNESLKHPLEYWDVNVNGSICLLSLMHSHQCKTLIFSSSATIYGIPKSIPINEKSTIQPINPYGDTKAAVERMLLNISGMNCNWRIASLRYFNPVGAHSSGLIGEDPTGLPNNLFPLVAQVASGKRKTLKVFGDNWPTHDKTCIRDYIHVMDLADGHLSALNYMLKKKSEYLTLNLGSGKGYSVLEVVNSFEKATGKRINYQIVDPRPGDAAASVADPTQAKKILGWQTRKTILDMCCDGWRWQQANPNGYEQKGRL